MSESTIPRARNLAVRRWIFAATASLVIFGAAQQVKAGTDVATYHNDNLRTGWNSTETLLTPANVQFQLQLQHTVSLDSQVDAQPLIATGQTIAGGTHDVTYVATENDTVYAIDAYSGQILLTRNFGTPVPLASIPGHCNTNAVTVGISATPVIDTATKTLYVIVDTFENGHAIYRIHALDLGTLADRVAPVVVSATQALSGGGKYSFSADNTRLRAGLVMASGNVYAAFTSYCDFNANLSRGWVLGWQTNTLTPMATHDLIDRQANSMNTYFLSTVWMSGAGVAADAAGSLYFVTGNSDPAGTAFKNATNLEESVVELSPDLKKVQSHFTPDGPDYGYQFLDAHDKDLGAGGILLLPPQPGAYPNMAVVAGKDGPTFLLNRDNLGGHGPNGAKKVLNTATNNRCWCTQSYFVASDGAGRVVTSTGSTPISWKIQTSAVKKTKPALVQDPNFNAGGIFSGLQVPGFFTSISSNGTQPNTGIIWAVSRPINTDPAAIQLYAFNATTGQTMVNIWGGQWQNTHATANIVPTVANGQVYVASNQMLNIFGLGAGTPTPALKTAAAAKKPAAVEAKTAAAASDTAHGVTGRIDSVDDTTVMLTTRSGKLTVDAADAKKNFLTIVLNTGDAVFVRGNYDPSGVMHAESIMRATDSPAGWDPDR